MPSNTPVNDGLHSSLDSQILPTNDAIEPIATQPAVNIFPMSNVEQYKAISQPRRTFWFDFGYNHGFTYAVYQQTGMEIDTKMRTDPEYHKTIGPYSQPMLEGAAANMRDVIESYEQSLHDADVEVFPYLAGMREERDAIQAELNNVLAFMARRRAYEDSVMDTVLARLDNKNKDMKREDTNVNTD